MNYREAMEFLRGTQKYGSRPGLEVIRELMHRLDDVQDRIPVIHIAGTNGKGSVGAMLRAVLTEAGYRAGHFSTPDVFSYEEEFQIGGVPVEKERLAELFTEVRAACRQMTKAGLPHPTRFEVETAAAYLWFYEEGCDAAVIEAGMGGETDATNLIRKPLLCILTEVSLDHTRFLGDTVEEIAAVKAGILKPGCPAVILRQDPAVMRIFEERCRAAGSPYRIAAEDSVRDIFLQTQKDGSVQTVVVRDTKEGPEKLALGLPGFFQIKNALCVLEALEFLKTSYPEIDDASIRTGLADARWPGRFEKIASDPDFYIDGAHNEGAVHALRETADRYLPGKQIVYIMGVLADKDYTAMIREMFEPGDRVFTVTPGNPRALDAGDLAALLQSFGINAAACESAAEAAETACREARLIPGSSAVLAFGSLSYLKEIRRAAADNTAAGL